MRRLARLVAVVGSAATSGCFSATESPARIVESAAYGGADVGGPRWPDVAAGEPASDARARPEGAASSFAGLGSCRPPPAPPRLTVWRQSGHQAGADEIGIPPPEACVRWPTGAALEVLASGEPGSQPLAACVVGHARRFAASVLRPALARLEHAAACASLLDVADVLGGDGSAPASLDETTRALAAVAIGSIVARRRAEEPRWSVPPGVLARLEDCITLTSTPRRARQACLGAVVAGGVVELIPALERELASCAASDRFAVAWALARLTATPAPAPRTRR